MNSSFWQANSYMKRTLLFLALALASVQCIIGATIPLYVNTDPEYYQVYLTQQSPNPPPAIDATAFDNQSVFSVSYQNYTTYPVLYQTLNTLYYTNESRSTMIANSPLYTNGFNAFFSSFGSGFRLDLHTTNQIPDAMAAVFDNEGEIRCDSIQDGNGLFSIDGFLFYEITSLGQFKASATNIYCPGSIDVGSGGLIQLTGRNVDLTGGSLSVEQPLNSQGLSSLIANFLAANFSGTGDFGLNTNQLWNPALSLGLTSATSSFVRVPPFYVILTNSQCYLDTRQPDPNNTNYLINRYVFVENDSPSSVTYNVYIDPPASSTLDFEAGAAHVEWVGSYIDPATGNPTTTYLYLTDDYLFGVSTNILLINGVPDNFTFLTSPSQLLFGSTPQDFSPLAFPNIFLTNRYSAMFGTLIGSTTSTNANILNPSGSITNLPCAVKITASNTLNLAFTTIAGPNYLSLNCTNQFLGSPGASITAPYSDIAVGVTNGFLNMSNILNANIPEYSGTIQAFNTVFTNIDSNGVTNDDRVLIVYSSLQPTTQPWIQNLYMHGTNQLIISDMLQVYGSLYGDAANITLVTNIVGEGATSLSGALTWYNPKPFNCNSGSGTQQFPNMLWLTNNGPIRVLQTANFGNSAQPTVIMGPATPPVRATGTLSEIGTNAVINDRVTIGTNVYTFVKTLSTPANQILWASSFNVSMSNLIAAINGAVGSGAKYSSSTRASLFVTASGLTNHAFTVTAISTNSAVGNAIVTAFTPATASSNLTWSGNATLSGGTDYIPGTPSYPTFMNHGVLLDEGTTLWTTYFETVGSISNGVGSFIEHSGLTVVTNSSITGNGDITFVATNSAMGATGITVVSNIFFAGNRLSLISSGTITDGGVTNGNVWSVGALGGGGAADSGFNTTIKPATGDLLGTTVTNTALASKSIYNVWAGHDYGISNAGYSNNLAVGHLILDSFGPDGKVAFNFSGAGISNALYVDLLELKNSATHGNATNDYNFPWLKINTNMVVYFANAIEDGVPVSVAEAIDIASRNGGNGGRLRWVYSYAGYFSSTNYLVTNLDLSVTTNSVNIALKQSSSIDSDSDGLPNSIDPTPFFLPSMINLTMVSTNVPPLAMRVQWNTIPNATNYVFYATNMMATNWLPFTNFNNWYFGNNVSRTNSAHKNFFTSPQTYIFNPSLPDNSQQTNVWILDPITAVPHYYRVMVWPWLNFPE